MDVLAFKCEGLQLTESYSRITSYEEAIDVIFAKISEHCRLKNKEIETVNKERDLARNQKHEIMRELDKFTILANKR